MSLAESRPWTDPIVAEVRAARAAIAARHGYDIERIAAALNEQTKAAGRQVASPASTNADASTATAGKVADRSPTS